MHRELRAVPASSALLLLEWPASSLCGSPFWESGEYANRTAKEYARPVQNSPWVLACHIGEYGVNTSRFGTDGSFDRIWG